METRPIWVQPQRGFLLCVVLLSGACSKPADGTAEQPSGTAGSTGPTAASGPAGAPAAPSGGAGARAAAAPSGSAGSAAVSGKAGGAAPSGGAGSAAQLTAGMIAAGAPGAAGMVAAGQSGSAGTAAGAPGSAGAPATGSATEVWIGPSQNNTNGDGNGFKLGGAAKDGDQNMGGAVHQVTNCISIGNHACGFTLNNNTKTPKLSMCGGTGDGKGMLCSLSNSGNVVVTSSASAAIMAKRKPDGSLPELP